MTTQNPSSGPIAEAPPTLTLAALTEAVEHAQHFVADHDPAGVIVHLPDGSVAGLEAAYVDDTCDGPQVLRLIVAEDES